MARDRPSSSEDGEQPRIKVTDRRLFDRQGNLRQPDTETSPPAPAEAEDTADQLKPTPGGDPARSTAPTSEVGPADARTDATASETSADVPASDEEATTAGEEAATSTSPMADRGEGEAPESERPIVPPHGPRPDELPRDFSAFVESHYFETMLYLGAVQHPQSGQLMEDIPLAKYKIDLLEMLKEKTAGNLTPEEDRLLEDVLYQLRMVYLQKTKAAHL